MMSPLRKQIMARDFAVALAIVSASGIAGSGALLAIVAALGVPLTREVVIAMCAPFVVAVGSFPISALIEAVWKSRKERTCKQ